LFDIVCVAVANTSVSSAVVAGNPNVRVVDAEIPEQLNANFRVGSAVPSTRNAESEKFATADDNNPDTSSVVTPPTVAMGTFAVSDVVNDGNASTYALTDCCVGSFVAEFDTIVSSSSTNAQPAVLVSVLSTSPPPPADASTYALTDC
jgi:hypothetical protein